MAQQPPPRGQVSPDGHWRWDGNAWVPNPSTAPPPQKRHLGRAIGLGCAGTVGVFIILLIVITAVSPHGQSGSKAGAQAAKATPTATAAPTTKAPTATPKSAAAPVVLATATGTTSGESPQFNGPSHYKVQYAFDCIDSSWGTSGNFTITPEDGNGNPVAGDLVNRLADSGSGTADGYNLGTQKGMMLGIVTECNWNVVVTTA